MFVTSMKNVLEEYQNKKGPRCIFTNIEVFKPAFAISAFPLFLFFEYSKNGSHEQNFQRNVAHLRSKEIYSELDSFIFYRVLFATLARRVFESRMIFCRFHNFPWGFRGRHVVFVNIVKMF